MFNLAASKDSLLNAESFHVTSKLLSSQVPSSELLSLQASSFRIYSLVLHFDEKETREPSNGSLKNHARTDHRKE